VWWPGTKFNHSACPVISNSLIPRSAQSAYSALIANPVCVLCAVANKPDQAAAEHATDFDVPIYNVWKQQEKTAGSGHFGVSARLFVDFTTKRKVSFSSKAGGFYRFRQGCRLE
jgi:hypothetical protein